MTITKLITIDIETSAGFSSLGELSPKMLELFQLRTKFKTPVDDDIYFQKAPLDAEFGRVVAFSIAGSTLNYYGWSEPSVLLSNCHSDEGYLLSQIRDFFNEELYRSFNTKIILSGHNIKQFDLPFLFRRSLYNKLETPLSRIELDKRGVVVLDSMQSLSNGQYEFRVKLDLVCELMGIASPKTDIDGSMVPSLFWSGEADAYERIQRYCEADTIAESLVCQNIIDYAWSSI